jgi:hypothetical protein
MSLTLRVEVPRDGSVALRWETNERLSSLTVLVVRTGAVPAYTSLRLAGDTLAYEITNLSRHQRYRIAVLGTHARSSEVSPWWTVTPRLGVAPRPDDSVSGLTPFVAAVESLTVMPQTGRLTVFWHRTPGFVDAMLLEVLQQGEVWKRLVLEPEVSSISLDRSRGIELVNGRLYGVRLAARFGPVASPSSATVTAVPAPQGEERQANRTLPQTHLVYPSLALTPEVRIFPEEEETAPAETPARLICFHCRAQVEWQEWKLRCRGCGAEFIPNGRGDYLELGRLRFGTCKCCLPTKILVQRAGSTSLCCAHSGKEHIRLPGARDYVLIEDLPYGLCQCCRPRRPLVKVGEHVVCGKSNERHRNENGLWVLVPTAPVFDAAAIDDLLDAGMAEICSTGVSRGSATTRRRR